MKTREQFAYTGRSPVKGYVGFVNIQETDDGVQFMVRSEGEAPVCAAVVIDRDAAIELLEKAIAGLRTLQ